MPRYVTSKKDVHLLEDIVRAQTERQGAGWSLVTPREWEEEPRNPPLKIAIPDEDELLGLTIDAVESELGVHAEFTDVSSVVTFLKDVAAAWDAREGALTHV